MSASRRRFLKGASATALGLVAPGISLARAPGEARFVLVLLRGGMDGLAAVPPHGDAWYRRARGVLALPAVGRPDGIVDLDGFFGLHAALAPLGRSWAQGELAVVHAAALPYRARSHFDAQDLLENGTASPHGARDGWLNRAVAALGGGPTPICFSAQVPLVLQGAAAATSVDPSRDSVPAADFMALVQDIYATDPVLGPALSKGLAAQAQVAETRAKAEQEAMAAGPASGSMGADSAARQSKRAARAAAALQTAGRVLAAANGPRIAVVESKGWDTHATQGTTTGRLRKQLDSLAQGLVGLQTGLGSAWQHTVVAVVSEFGRTVAPNGSKGTDHGTAGVALLLGGAVQGGRSLGTWPGLAPEQRHDGRDLQPTTDVRSVFKGVLRDHLGLAPATLEEQVFPDSRDAPALSGLVRA